MTEAISVEVALLRDEHREAEYDAYERQWVTLKRGVDGSYDADGPVMFPEVTGSPVHVAGFYVENRELGIKQWSTLQPKTFKAGVAPALFDIRLTI